MPLIAIDIASLDPDLVADRCWQAGATALWEPDDRTLRVGVDEDGLAGFLSALADLDPTDVTDDEAVELAGRWASVTVGVHDIDLWVPPTVFGDGHHPTTATCLDLLPSLVTAGDRVLDVGCGAGALSIGAALLGGEVTAIDIDPAAVEATRGNAARNGAVIAVPDMSLDGVDARFDVVLANLTVGGLRPIVADLVSRTTPAGTMVLCGMLEDQWPEICSAAGGTTQQIRLVEGWLTAVVGA